MEPHYSNERREVRFMVEAGATVEVGKNGQTIHATTVNMSGGGVLLHFDAPVPLAPGDQLSCEFRVEHGADLPLPYWGLGEVVRVVEGCNVAIVLKAGGFSASNRELPAPASGNLSQTRASLPSVCGFGGLRLRIH